MDFKKILEKFDAAETEPGINTKTSFANKGSMIAILENLNRIETESKDSKPDYLDLDKDGDKDEPMKKAAKDKEEANESAESELEEAIMISAEGSEAEALLQILKLSGMAPPPAPAPMSAPAPVASPAPDLDTMGMEMQDEYSNSPDELEQDIDSVISTGNDLHKEKTQYAASQPGDNPMKAFEGRFKSILNDLLKENQ